MQSLSEAVDVSEGFSRTRRVPERIIIRKLPLMPLEDGVERSRLVADIIPKLNNQRGDPNPDWVWGSSGWNSEMLSGEYQNVP